MTDTPQTIRPIDEFFRIEFEPISGEPTVEIPTIAVGERLKDRYRVLNHIGSGGMADVFHGWDDLFQRDVAIKVLKRRRISEMMMKRVLREARASCAVDHPHMLRVTDMGYVHGAPFLVTDLLRGASLADELRRAPGGRLDWRRVVTWMLPAMEALHMAHEAGLVHRDIKPENLFLHRRGDREVLVVLDLGIVKFVDLPGKPTRWTQSGLILGTAAYMAPEQANGGPVDRRTDVYALGVTLYRLLSGSHLFPSATADGPFVPMTRHIYEAPPRLDDPALPPALVDAVHVALMKDPAARHPSMARFAELLAACLAPAPRASRARRLGRSARHVVQIGVGACIVLAVQQIGAMEAAVPRVEAASPASPAPAITSTPTAPDGDDSPGVCEPLEDLSGAPTHQTATSAAIAGPAPPAAQPSASKPPSRPPAPRSFSTLQLSRQISDADPFLQATDTVRRCMQAHADPDTRNLRVRLIVRGDGRVQTASIVGDDEPAFLDDCVYDRLTRLRFAPGARRTLEHTYTRAGETAR